MSPTILLHQWEISPFCQKAARSLRCKGLAFQTVDYNGLLATRAGRLSKVGKLPVLEIDGQRIQDSTRIARYLDQHHPEPPLYPADPVLHAQAELWEDWADELLYWYEVYLRAYDPAALDQAVRLSCAGRPAAERVPVKLVLRTALRQQLRNQGLGRMPREDVEAEFLRQLDRLETVLTQSDWLVGRSMTIADIAAGSQLLEVDRTSDRMRPQLQRRPHLAAWLSRVKAV
ncbi:MAG: glutathione S-transferase family protein [Nevskia sp.]|nr:glutathione S-transferase family protein [Nevskia sp.]